MLSDGSSLTAERKETLDFVCFSDIASLLSYIL